MQRAEVWCRVLAWLQIGGALATAAAIHLLWSVFIGAMTAGAGGDLLLGIFKWGIILFMALPPLLAGILTLIFAGHVERARQGSRDEQHVLLRVLMALAGLWSAGVIGFLGISLPPIGFFAVLGLASAFLAIMGQDWTADLLKPHVRP
jgi:hypothetical protein